MTPQAQMVTCRQCDWCEPYLGLRGYERALVQLEEHWMTMHAAGDEIRAAAEGRD